MNDPGNKISINFQKMTFQGLLDDFYVKFFICGALSPLTLSYRIGLEIQFYRTPQGKEPTDK